MSKEIRMSTINSSSSNKTNTLNITNSSGDTFDYQFDNTNKRLMRRGQVISPSNVDLIGWFYIRKSGAPAARALVTIIMKIESQGFQAEEQGEIYLQSTVSSRGF
jgi:hypothetical protein